MTRKIFLVIVLCVFSMSFSGCRTDSPSAGEEQQQDLGKTETEDETRIKELPLKGVKKDEELRLCMQGAERYADLYAKADKGTASNIVLDTKTIHQIVNRLGENGYPVSCSYFDCNLLNYQKLDECLRRAADGEAVTAEYYTVLSSGGLSRYALSFSEGILTIINTRADWTETNEPHVYYQQCYQVYDWKYTEKGWLITEKAKSINQEMDMHSLVRVLPLSEECRKFGETYILPIGYACSNLLYTDWSADTVTQLNLSGLFPAFYQMNTGRWPTEEDFPNDIPEAVFEETFIPHLPVTAQQLKALPEYQAGSSSYVWNQVGCGTKQLAFPPFPEVVKTAENSDGSVTLTVDAVSKENGTDCSFSHEVTLRIKEDGTAEYLKNRMLSS
ncbi:DUF6070 family protein [Ruminococcus sp. OA3]|uniref:DUF6070 family protein n=1 Tax=Ruminococcus sp. OA3 TaxID=2914164 RepID=UPI001F06131E|nr:DUF6070 family protein [Ruminococcus sp. OA3]MCH1983299.1 DUF6070 family protein [Ruminococcus sp. OA3]